MKNMFKYLSALTFVAAIGFSIRYVINVVHNIWIKQAIGFLPDSVVFHWSWFVSIGCLLVSAIFLAIHAKKTKWGGK